MCHVGILWAEESLPLAAAGQMLDGKALYRDIWFDKPPLMAAGFAAVNGAAMAWLWAAGALPSFWAEVWQWGRLYAGAALSGEPLRNGLLRTVNWAGFHVALVVAALWFFARTKERWRWAG